MRDMAEEMDAVLNAMSTQRMAQAVTFLKNAGYRMDAVGATSLLLAAACMLNKFGIERVLFLEAADAAWGQGQALVDHTDRVMEILKRSEEPSSHE